MVASLADSLAGLPWFLLDDLIKSWLVEDLGRGDQTTLGLGVDRPGRGMWYAKASGIIAGLPVAARLFHWLDAQVVFTAQWQRVRRSNRVSGSAVEGLLRPC